MKQDLNEIMRKNKWSIVTSASLTTLLHDAQTGVVYNDLFAATTRVGNTSQRLKGTIRASQIWCEHVLRAKSTAKERRSARGVPL